MEKLKIYLSLTAVLLCIQGYAVTTLKINKPNPRIIGDTTINSQIRTQLSSPKSLVSLYFPQSVIRFYKQDNFSATWIKPQSSTGKTWEAMLMIDCVLQFGLSHDDYHPHELLYDKLHQMLDKPAEVSSAEKARFDIMLTDAMLAFINHLHYGKLNPHFTAMRIDAGKTSFSAEEILTSALLQKDLMNAVVKVQPQMNAYQELAEYMRLVKGQYIDDCYEVPEATVRMVAINMERLRWINTASNEYLEVNIPSYTLKFHTVDSVYTFRVTIGSPANPTPMFQGSLGGFTSDAFHTIAFKLLSPFKNDLKCVGQYTDNGFNNGYIGIEHGEKLAGLLLKYGYAGNKSAALNKAGDLFKAQTVTLRKPVPFIVTYLTCEMKNGALVSYNDIYKLDKNLEMEIYNLKKPLTMR